MRINELKDGQTVRARWGRAGPKGGTDWCLWREVALHVQHDRLGRVSLIALKGTNWAEYAPADYSERYSEFVVEDYYLQIEGLVP